MSPANVRLYPTIKRLHDDGFTLQGIADRLNKDGIRTPTGLPWQHIQQICRILKLGAAHTMAE